jgi:glycosyltransferase involved in cell wall biosynthesis
VTILCTVAAREAGLTILASRWAHCLRGLGLQVEVNLPKDQHPDEERGRRHDDLEGAIAHVRRRKAESLLVMGLPAEDTSAASVVRLCLELADRCALLWERPHHPQLAVASGIPEVSQFAGRLLTLNPLTRDLLEAAAPKAAVFVVAPAIPDGLFAVPYQPGRHAREIVNIGRTSPQKRTVELAELWTVIGHERRLPLKILTTPLAGHPDAELLAAVERSSPWIERQDGNRLQRRREALERACAAVFPAAYDHLPQALLETMAAGVPSIVTPIDAHTCVIRDGETGLVMASPDLETGLPEALDRLLASGDDVRAAIGQQAREAVRRQYSTSAVAVRLADVLFGDAAA